jgi:hypothetical protein
MSASGTFLQAQREADVLRHRHVRIKGIGLEHHGDAALVRRHVVDALAVEDQIAVVDALKAGDHAQQRRFSAAGRPDEDGEFAILDGDVDALDDFQGTVEFADVLEIDHLMKLFLDISP